MAPHGPALEVRFHGTDPALSEGSVAVWAEALSRAEGPAGGVSIVVVDSEREPLGRENAARLEQVCAGWAVGFRSVAIAPGSTLADLDAALGVRAEDLILLAHPEDLPSPALVERLGAVLDGRELAVADARPVPGLRQESSDADDAPAGVCVMVTGRTSQALGRIDASDPGTTIARLLEEASTQGIAVVSDPTASIFHADRVRDEEPPAQLGRAADRPGEEHSDASHPALLRATSLAEILRQTGVRPTVRPHSETTASCFLTVLTRTQGNRPALLEEMLLCLAAQTVRDFEVILVCHRVTSSARADTERILARFPEWLQRRVRIIEVDRPGRAAPLNDGLDAANGRYVVVLDDDDLVFAHWVETFLELEERAPGRLLRACALRQDVRQGEAHGRLTALPVGTPKRDWPASFELVDHLKVNSTPCMTIAFPRGIYHDLRHRFDESLHATEDWEYLVRAASVAGVESDPRVTSVYRWWVDEISSRAVQSQEDWDQGRHLAEQSFDGRVVLLPRGSARRIRELFDQNDEAWGEVKKAIDLHDIAVENYRGLKERFRRNKERMRAAESEVEELKNRLRQHKQRADERIALMRELDTLLSTQPRGVLGAPAWRSGRSRAEQRSRIFDMSRRELHKRIRELRGP